MIASIETGHPGDGPQASSRFTIRHRGPARGRAYETWLDDICRAFCRLDIAPAAIAQAQRDRPDPRNTYLVADATRFETDQRLGAVLCSLAAQTSSGNWNPAGMRLKLAFTKPWVAKADRKSVV